MSPSPESEDKPLSQLSEQLARHVHETWMENRRKDGWVYGERRDDVLKTHPCLVPYEQLSEEEKDYDRATSQETILFIREAGFEITLERPCLLKRMKNALSPLRSYLSNLWRHPLLTVAHAVTAGGCRSLFIFVLPAVFFFVLFTLAVLFFTFLCDIVLIPNDPSCALEAPKAVENSLYSNLRGMVFLFLDPGYLYYNMDESSWVEIFALGMSLLGMLLINGLLVSTIVNYFSRLGDSVLKGQMHFPSIKKHAVMIGYSEMGMSILKEILKTPADELPHVIIMTSKDVEALRPRVYAQLQSGDEKRVIFYSGDSESKEDLESLNIPSATTIYITGEEESEGRDSKNIECLHLIADLLKEHTATQDMKIYVQYDRLSSSAIAQKFNFKKIIIDPLLKQHPENEISIHAFNFYESWARLLWGSQARWNSKTESTPYLPLDQHRLDASKQVHLVIIGFNRMGRALLLEALRVCHYPQSRQTRITIIDPDAERKIAFFRAQFPHIESQVKDIKIEFKADYAEGLTMRGLLQESAEDDTQLLTVAVCVRDADTALAIGMNLPEAVYDSKGDAQILIRQELHGGMSKQIDRDSTRYRNVRSFGMIHESYRSFMVDDTLAAIVNQNYDQLVNRGETKASTIQQRTGDIGKGLKKHSKESLKKWGALSEVDRWSNRYQIDMFDYYCRFFESQGVDSLETLQKAWDYQASQQKPDEPRHWIEDLAETEHRRWMAERSILGWRQCREGESRDNDRLIHNCLIDYYSLPLENQEKDIDAVINAYVIDHEYKKYLNKKQQKKSSDS